MKLLKIYLAIPYSHEDKAVREMRFREANYQAARLMKLGHIVFSPISHSHPIAEQESLPLDFDYWKEFNNAFIKWCDELWVIMLPGWKESVGVTAEIKTTRTQRKPIIYYTPKGGR